MAGRVLSELYVMVALSTVLVSDVVSQQLAARGPRFLASLVAPGRMVDASDAAPLRRRVSLDLTEATPDEALKEITRQASLEIAYSAAMFPSERTVSIHARGITVAAALTEVLLDAGVDVTVLHDRTLALIRRAQVTAAHENADSGRIVGRVSDKATGAPLATADISVEGVAGLTTTDKEGRYALHPLPPGTYKVRVRCIGYAPAATSISLSGTEDVTADFELERSTQELDQIVVTGTLIPTERKVIPTPLTVLTSEDIEKQGMTRLDQVFRSNVPGSFSWDQDAGDYLNSINVRGANSLIVGQNSVKVYIDGVEVSDNVLSAVDMSTVERIEVIRGPQASTVYGSAASGGVLQIFTKKGEPGQTRSRIGADVAVGAVQSPYDDAALQEYSASAEGSSPDASYHLAAGYSHTGAWVPSFHSRSPSIAAGARTVQGDLTMELSARYLSRSLGTAWDPRFRTLGYPSYQTPPFRNNDLTNQTYGVNLSYDAPAHWRHNLVLGFDRTANDFHNTRARPEDSLFFLVQGNSDKASIRYNTSVTFSLTPDIATAVTAGIEHFTARTTGSFNSGAETDNGAIFASPNSLAIIFRGTTENTGYFSQAQISIRDAVFVTAGVRAERNTNFGTDYGTALAPRVGLSIVQPVGPVTLKGRAAYGRAIRPPDSPANLSGPGVRANPNLGPEDQVGGDVGVDLYFGNRASVSATYYSQLARGLIQDVLVDPDAIPATFQLQNVGRVRNKGFEIDAKLRLRDIQLTAQYSRTNSIVRDVGPAYTGDLQAGDRLLAIPRETAGATATIQLLSGTQATAGFTYLGSWVNTDWLAMFRFFFAGEPFRGSGRDYWIAYPAVSKLSLGVIQTLSDNLSAYMQVNNLTNNQRYEQSNLSLTPGRRTTVGVRLSY